MGTSVFKGSYTNYTRNFMPVHLELRYEKEFDLGAVKLPLGVSFVVNPFTSCCFASASAGVAF